MKLRTKLLFAQVPLLAALVLVGAVGSFTARQLGRGAEGILRDNYRSVLAAQRMSADLARIDQAALLCVADECEQSRQQAEAARRAFEAELTVQEGNVTEAGEAEATRALRAAWSSVPDALARLARGGNARALYAEELAPALERARRSADAILALNQDAMVRKSDAAERSAARLNALLIAAAALGCASGLLASGLLTARLLRPLGVLSQAARRLGEGDAAARARVEGKDELAQVATEFNTMADHLERYRESTLGELLAAHRSAQAVIDSLPDPVLVLGVAGDILHLNQAAETLLRLRPEIGLAGIDPALRTVLERVRGHVLGGHGAVLPEELSEAVRVATPDGERRLLPGGSPVYSEQGAVVGSAIVLQDVTRLLSFEELRNDLVATVAHEFRTPLTSLHMAIHLLYEGAAGDISEKQAELLHAAREDCARLQHIVDELLDLSRIQAGSIELRLAAAEPETLISHALDAQRAGAERAEVELRSEVLPGTGRVQADPERIELAFANLLSNAIRHSAQGGVVTLRATATPDGDGFRFEVVDHGPGIPREYRQAIFERYFQLPGSHSRGAGLGLYIAREIVRAHGGEIGLEDTPGGGATFWLTLRCAGNELPQDPS